MQHFDFIDIGTSDFDYTIPNNNQFGIYVEPIKYYIDKIPNYPNTIKLQVAISETNANVDIFYLDPNFILNHNLPKYLKGCNAINKIHPTIISECKRKNINYLDGLITDHVECISFKNLVLDYEISNIDSLKIDTEGGDCEIVAQVINLHIKNILSVRQIIFESNSLTPIDTINKTYNLLEKNNWTLTKKYKGSNTMCINKDYKCQI